jgi:hypothetical protein
MTRASKSALLGPRQKLFLYATAGLLWITGALWLFEKYAAHAAEGTWTTAQTWGMKIHGAAAMLFLLSLGGLLLQHVPAGWAQGSKRRSGVLSLGVCGIMVLTGWCLYYVTGDRLRDNMGLVHGFLGLSLPLVIGIHAWIRAEERRQGSDRRRIDP